MAYREMSEYEMSVMSDTGSDIRPTTNGGGFTKEPESIGSYIRMVNILCRQGKCMPTETMTVEKLSELLMNEKLTEEGKACFSFIPVDKYNIMNMTGFQQCSKCNQILSDEYFQDVIPNCKTWPPYITTCIPCISNREPNEPYFRGYEIALRTAGQEGL